MSDDLTEGVNPAGVLARVSRFGQPHHGRITKDPVEVPEWASAALVKQDGTVMPWAPWAWLAAEGDVFYQRLPSADLAALPTPEQAQAEQQAGVDLRDDIVIPGGLQLYGQDLPAGAWIFGAPSGKRWLIQTDLHGHVFDLTPNSLDIAWTATLFGELGGDPSQVSGTISMQDIGQAYPSFVSSNGISYTTAIGTLRDINLDGSQAIFEITLKSGLYSIPGPAGWLLATVSEAADGAVSVAFSVYKTRQQTIGVYSESDVTQTPVKWQVFAGGSCDPPPPDFPPDPVLYGIPPFPTTQCEVGVSYTITQSDVYAATFSSWEYRRDINVSLSGRVVGVYFDGNRLVDVTLDYSHTETYHSRPPVVLSATGTIIYIQEWVAIDGPSGPYWFWAGSQSERTEPGAVCPMISIANDHTHTAASSMILKTSDGQSARIDISHNESERYVNYKNILPTKCPPAPPLEFTSSYYSEIPVPYSRQRTCNSGFPCYMVPYFRVGSDLFILAGLEYFMESADNGVDDPPKNPSFLRIKRLSNKVFRLEFQFLQEEYSTGVIGAGSLPADTPRLAPPRYLSVDPRTGEVVESDYPVNFV